MKIEAFLNDGHKPYLLLKHLLPPGIDKEIINATQDQYESLKENQDLRKLLEELNTYEAVKAMKGRNIPVPYRKGIDGSRSVSEAAALTGRIQRGKAAVAGDDTENNDLRASKDTTASRTKNLK